MVDFVYFFISSIVIRFIVKYIKNTQCIYEIDAQSKRHIVIMRPCHYDGLFKGGAGLRLRFVKT